MATWAVTPEIEAARSKWHYRGQLRPRFAEPTADDEESVWDFPRPPRIDPVHVVLRVTDSEENLTVAETHRGLRVCETAGAPTYYFPPQDVDATRLQREADWSLCEWKGHAISYAVFGHPSQAWCYESVFPEFVEIRGWYGFYPTTSACFIGSERVKPQPGGYYGGWVTDRLRGPIKGADGTEHW
ncbi:MAG: DUF427 domain-containing protein [Pseudomonadales bacterium]